jgi:tight adherence protein B
MLEILNSLLLCTLFLSLTSIIYLLLSTDYKKYVKKLSSSLQDKKIDFKNLSIPKAKVLKKFIPSVSMVFFLLGLAVGFLSFNNVFFAICSGALFYFLPQMVYKYQYNRLIDKFETQLMEALKVMSNMLRAGANIHSAIKSIAEQFPSPLSNEFNIVSKEIELGKSLPEALKDVITRIDSRELRVCVSAINIVYETGGNLSAILSELSETLKERKRIQGRVKVLTAQGRLSAYIIGFLPFILMFILNLIDPEFMKPFFTSIVGYAMISIVIILVVLGFIIINKIVQIEI